MKNATTKAEIVHDIQDARAKFERANVLLAPFRFLPGDTMRLAKIALDGGLALSR